MKIKNIRYDAAAGAFEARVDVEHGGRTFRYPCVVRGPITMDEEIVRACVVHQASQMSGLKSNLYSHA